MIKALFFKEWIKLRYFWCIPFIFAGAALADYHLTFKGVLSMHGAVDTWNGLIFKESIYFGSLQWAFILGGIWLASVQMAPECVGKRLRLLFHLPVNAIPALAVQAVTGLGLMALVFCAASAGFALINNHHGLPPELSVPMFKTLLPTIIGVWNPQIIVLGAEGHKGSDLGMKVASLIEQSHVCEV